MGNNKDICEGKMQYAKPKSVLKAMERIVRSGRVIDKLGFYRCSICARYHVTTIYYKG